MGLFGPSKFENAMRSVEDAKIFFERFKKVFVDNISIKKENGSNYGFNTVFSMNNSSCFFTDKITDEIFHIFKNDPTNKITDDRLRFKYVTQLFDFYPCDIADDGNALFQAATNNFTGGFPAPYLLKCSIVKSNTQLILKAGGFAKIEQVCNEFYAVLNRSFQIVEEYKSSVFNNNYEALYRELLPIYYKGKGAITWFNYLNKIQG